VHLEAAEGWLHGEQGRRRFRQRKVYIETTFAWAKDIHGLRRAQWRGKRKVQIQVWLTAAAMNLKKLAKAVGDEPQRGLPSIPRLMGFMPVSLTSVLGILMDLKTKSLATDP
jgi:hypothetical protein